MTNLTEIQKEIHEKLELFQSLKVVESHLDEINKKLAGADRELDMLDKEVLKELQDLEKLEKGGIKSTFYKVLGSKEEQLEKERQEYLEQALKFNEQKKLVELMEFEKELLSKKLVGLPKLTKELKKLKKLREKEILNSNDIRLKSEFRDLLESIDFNRLFNNELKEAIATGTKARSSLSNVNNFLKQALNWGQWDMVGSKRGRMSSHMKHNAIDKANRALSRAQHELNLFKRELEDINSGRVEFNLNISNFSRFTDFFFDNLITDWIIQQKIKNSKSSVESTMDSVSRILASINHELEENNKEYLSLQSKREQFLVS